QNLSEERTPLTLHVLGEPMPPADEPAYIVSMLGKNFLDHVAAAAEPASNRSTDADRRAWLRAQGERLVRDVVIEAKPPAIPLSADLAKDLELARGARHRLEDTGQEIRGLLRGLDARYVVPGPGPEPIRNPESAPGGRNLYSLNPEEIPTRP